MSINDPAGSPGGEARKAAKKRELIRLAEKNFRRTRESERYWPETVIAIDQADDEDALDDALAGARMVDHIFEVGLQRFANLRPSA